MSDTKNFEPEEDQLVEVDFEVIPSPSVQAHVMDRSEEPDDELSVMVGAGIAGGCVGCVIGGPTLACIAGLGSAYGTTLHDSAAGDATRSMGRIAISCQRNAVEINEKHHILDKNQVAVWSCWETTNNLSKKHRVMDHTKECVKSSWQGMKGANAKYHLVDRTWEGVTSTCNTVGKNISGENLQDSSTAEVVVASAAVADEGESGVPDHGMKTNGAYVAVAGGKKL